MTAETLPPVGSAGPGPSASGSWGSGSSGTLVDYARVSFSWFALNVSALADTAPEDQQRWGRSLAWRSGFNTLRAGQPLPFGNRSLSAPWAPGPGGGEALWSDYAWGNTNRRVPVRSAWANVFPVRVGPPARLVENSGWAGVVHELIYPHGVACVLDLRFTARPAALRLADFCDVVADFRRAPHTFEGSVGGTGMLSDIAERRLWRLSRAAFGHPPDNTGDCWTVSTVVAGAPGRLETGQQRRRYAGALIDGLADWRSAPLDGITGPTSTAVAGQLVETYAGSSGRWIHGPSLLAEGRGLADFHRATMWMSVQVDALGALANYLAATDLGDLPAAALGLRRPVAMALGRLRGGAGPVPGPAVTQQLADRGYSAALAGIRAAEQLD